MPLCGLLTADQELTVPPFLFEQKGAFVSFTSSLRMRRLGLTAGVATALIITAAGPAAAESETTQLGLTNGHCNKTVLSAKAGTRAILDVVSFVNPLAGASLTIPEKNISVSLPDTYYWMVTRVDLGINDPGQVAFQVLSPPVTGSAGSGCRGVIRFE
ncbi:hypothetical protein ACL02S_19070 [Nocardia sp. 004]|uniref:hypothetical protein n=1 Tax=Nocardia sp. 004 TaxID=3385978 RepID=UPI0039A046D5